MIHLSIAQLWVLSKKVSFIDDTYLTFRWPHLTLALGPTVKRKIMKSRVFIHIKRCKRTHTLKSCSVQIDSSAVFSHIVKISFKIFFIFRLTFLSNVLAIMFEDVSRLYVEVLSKQQECECL